MNRYNFEITIQALSQEEAIAKLKASSMLMQQLRPHELARLADVVKNDPVKTAIAKRALGL